MIRYLQIENYKALRNVGLVLSNLNLFFGMNGMGKSSVLQSLMLLRQSYWRNNQTNLSKLYVNGELIDSGNRREIITHSTDSDQIRYYVGFDGNHSIDVSYTLQLNNSMDNILKGKEEYLIGEDIKTAGRALLSDGFYYLGAERLGPQPQYSANRWNNQGINPFGNDGRYTVPFLAIYGNTHRVAEELHHKNARSDRLIDQVNAWMGEISPNIQLEPTFNPIDSTAKLWISYRMGNGLETEANSPINVGYGIPYVLPLVVVLLIAVPGDLILVENPGSHLHPRGQSQIAELMAKSAQYGVQILCESHSDHIINGVRVAVKNKKLDCNKVTINYFDQNEDQESSVTSIEVDKYGSLNRFPRGLLDEWGYLMSELIKRD